MISYCPMFGWLVLFLILFTPQSWANSGQLVDRIMAVVNDEVITQSEFDSVFRPIYDEMSRSGQVGEEDLNQLRLKLLNQMIEDRLVHQEAKKMGVQVMESEVQEELNAFKSNFPDLESFENQMKAEGMSLAAVEDRIRERLSIQKLHDYFIRGKVVIPPLELEEYFKEHPEEFVQKEALKLRVITLRKSEEARAKGTMDEKQKKEADRIRALILKGDDFGALAKQYSQDPYAQSEGAMDLIQKGALTPNIEEVLFQAEAGALTEVLETEIGYHIFKIEEKIASKTPTFEEAKAAIHNKLFRKKAHDRFVTWMEDLKQKAFITIR